MRNLFSYFFYLLIAGIFCLSCSQKDKPHLPSLDETYGAKDRNPFGSFIAYNQLQKIFQYRYVEKNEKPFDEVWKEIKEYSDDSSYSLYVLISSNIITNGDETDAMLNFIKEGNDMFIAADYIDHTFLEKIHCSEERNKELAAEIAGKMNTTSVKIPKDAAGKSKSFNYYYFPFINSFYDYDSVSTRVLGLNEEGDPDYIVIFLGKGRLYLHAAPRTFGNYFLLTQNNYRYLENILSYLRPDPKNIYWDEYYKTRPISKRNSSKNNNDDDFSSLSVIKKNPPLLWAFILCIGLITSYVLFNIKRKQKIIDERKQNVNTTVAFTETIGRLYLQKKNNKHISEKMITYFYEYVRNRFFINTSQPGPAFIKSLAGKSGVDVATTEKLFDTIDSIQSQDQISDTELLSLNEQVENFYKKRN